MNSFLETFRKNRTLYITLAALFLLFIMAVQGMDTRDWVITLLRSLAVGSITFLVAAGFSIIFGLMDVLNLAHGTLFMIGAYVGWTVFVRPDTFVDATTPIAIVIAGFVLQPLWTQVIRRLRLRFRLARSTWLWIGGLVVGALVLVWGAREYPITSWDPANYAESPVTYAFNASQGVLQLPDPQLFNSSPNLVLLALIFGALITSFALAGLSLRKERVTADNVGRGQAPRTAILLAVIFFAVGLSAYMFHGALTGVLVSISSNWLFVIAMVVALLTGFGLGTLMESTMIRPLYARPTYQILMTLGLSAIGIEVVRAVWGRPEFTMPKPAIFSGTGEGCPATNLADLLANQCSTIEVLGGRVRTYNEIFVPLLGLIVLIAFWVLLQRTRLGMIIRAGVQDSEMVEALGINVRRVFTLVFAMGVGLAALGGVTAAPSMGVSLGMGDALLINALIALAIGGLTSFPGAAAGSLLVGLMQQFIIKYGQLGINIPFLAEPFKPTPPLVPASTVFLMVIVLLLLPQGLFGRKE